MRTVKFVSDTLWVSAKLTEYQNKNSYFHLPEILHLNDILHYNPKMMNIHVLECIRNNFLPQPEHVGLNIARNLMPGLQQRHKIEKIRIKQTGFMERLNKIKEEWENEYFYIEAYNHRQLVLDHHQTIKSKSENTKQSIVRKSLYVMSKLIVLLGKCSFR